MTGRERILNVLNQKETDRIPWLPFAGVHAGYLAGYTAEEVSRDGDKCFRALCEVNRLYRPDGQPVMFDLQIEAEILGCDLSWSEDSPPMVISHPLEGTCDIPRKIPGADEGRLSVELEVMGRMKKEVGDFTALYGLLTGPFTLALHLRGMDLFMDMTMNPDYVAKLIDYCTDVAAAVAGYFMEAGMDVIAVVDPLVSLISPSHFGEFLEEPFRRLFSLIGKKGVKSSFFVCGDAFDNLESMCRTGCDSVSVDESINLAEAKKICDARNVVLGGNIPLTTVMLNGTEQDNMRYVVDLIDSLDNSRNLIIATGCDMPYATPRDNVLAAERAVHDTETVREILGSGKADTPEPDVELPDYRNLKKPLVEVFVLDPRSCASCSYMLQAAREVREEFGNRIDLAEYEKSRPGDASRFRKMGVKQIPAIYINGKPEYSSRIPTREELSRMIGELL